MTRRAEAAAGSNALTAITKGRLMSRSLARMNRNEMSTLGLVRTSALALGAAITALGCAAPVDQESNPQGEVVAQTSQALNSGTYEIRPVNSNKCLDVPGASMTNGEQIKQYSCNGQNNQKWQITNLGGNLHQITAVHSGKSMNVYGGNMPAGAKIKQWNYDGGANAKFYIDGGSGGYTIKPSYNTGLCFDVFGNNSNDNNELGIWNCNNQNNEKFYINAVGSAPPPAAASWHTDWEDQFNGSWLDRGKWTVVVGMDGNFNGEQQWYVDEEGNENNFWVANGELKIKVQREDRNFGFVKNYTSARLTTKGKFTPSNGAWEARLSFWAGGGAGGVWPAFWLLGSNVNEPPYAGSSCWPTWGAREIDIFEYTTNSAALNPSAFITNFIQGNGCQQAAHSRQDVFINPYGYNTYRMEFWGGQAKIFVNGQFIRSVNDDPWQDQGYAAILNVAMGGGLGGGVSWPGGASAGITVDYVRHQGWW
jgi:hypothetical protein